MVALFVDLPIKIYAQQAPSRPEGLGAPWKVDPRHIAICSPRESCLLCTATKPWGLNRVSPDCSLPTRRVGTPRLGRRTRFGFLVGRGITPARWVFSGRRFRPRSCASNRNPADPPRRCGQRGPSDRSEERAASVGRKRAAGRRAGSELIVLLSDPPAAEYAHRNHIPVPMGSWVGMLLHLHSGSISWSRLQSRKSCKPCSSGTEGEKPSACSLLISARQFLGVPGSSLPLNRGVD